MESGTLRQALTIFATVTKMGLALRDLSAAPDSRLSIQMAQDTNSMIRIFGKIR
jgi:hypothetical protein